MHEIGHTMGLTHANENGAPYADSTGYMSAGDKGADWPRKCFNGHKVRIEQCCCFFVLFIGGGSFVQIILHLSIEGLLICSSNSESEECFLSFADLSRNYDTHRHPSSFSLLISRSRTGFLGGTKIAT
jgi:hypothetical protein